MMMKAYTTPEIEVLSFEAEDVIATSGITNEVKTLPMDYLNDL